MLRFARNDNPGHPCSQPVFLIYQLIPYKLQRITFHIFFQGREVKICSHKTKFMRLLYALVFILLSMQASAIAPTTPSHNLYFGAIDGGYFNLGWAAGDGARRIMICKAGSPVTFIPQNGVDYNHNTEFGDGQQVAPGEFIVYDHFSSSFYLTGLSPATQYFFAIFEYNGTGTATEYLTSTFLTGNGTTSATPTQQTSNATFPVITTNSVNINWAIGNGYRRLIVVREGAPVNADPVSGQPYNVSYLFGTGATTGPGNYTVYNSTGNGTNVNNLKAGTEYYFAFYEFNGSGQPQYLIPAYTTSVTTRSVPTIASAGLTITKTDGKELFLDWTSGNGQRRIIVAKQGSDITSTPVNGTDYNANPTFGQGQTLGTGEYVVYDDNFHQTSITGLNPATTYYFKIFEYDGTGTTTAYLTTSFASVNGPTASTPTIQASNISATEVTPNSVRLQLAKGDGRARLLIGRKNSPVNVAPVNFTIYTYDSDFGDGQDLGNGNFVLTNTIENFVTVHNLEPASTYHFAVFELNGFNQPLYLAPAAVFSATTLGALPVKLTKWEAIPSENKVTLQWTTSSELNSGHFVIERSSNGTNFSPIATVQASGNSPVDINYTKDDINPLSGKSYYRLKIVDLDGHTEYSAIRSVLLSAKQTAVLMRNPVQDVLELVTAMNASNSRNEWQIVNASGQIVKKGIVSPGRTEINVSLLNAGTYWLRLNISNQPQTLPFIKQ